MGYALRKMNLNKYYILLLLLFVTACDFGNKETKVLLTGFGNEPALIYDRGNTKIYLSKSSLISFSQKSNENYSYLKKSYHIITAKGDTRIGVSWPDLDTLVFRGETIPVSAKVFRKTFYHEQDSNLEIIVKIDTVFDPTTNLINFLNSWSSKTITVDATNSKLSNVLDAAIIEIMKTGEAKVFDVIENKFVSFITIKETEDNLSGSIEMYLPSQRIFFGKLLWIR
jgi:hypothetical protein